MLTSLNYGFLGIRGLRAGMLTSLNYGLGLNPMVWHCSVRNVNIRTNKPSKPKEMKQVSLDIDDLVKSMNSQLKSSQTLSENCCIYRASTGLRELNRKAYTPQVVSIGPYHYGKKKLEAMEYHKRRYLHDFLKRMTGNGMDEKNNGEELVNERLKDLIERTAKSESRLRYSYAETIDMVTKEFVEMMLVDASFMVEYLLKRYRKEWKKNDRIFGKQRMTNSVRLDILLIENQIPYFFLKELFNFFSINADPQQEIVSFKDLVHDFLKDINIIMWDWSVEDDREVQHLVHFLQIGLGKSLPKDEAGGTTEYAGQVAPTISDFQAGGTTEYAVQVAPTISDLHKAGVKFKASSTSESHLNIKFNDGILEIPKWKLTDHTEILFRNIQAFERWHRSENSLTDYISIMDFLVNTSEDIKLLVENDIIENWLMDNQTATTLINRLGDHNLIDDDFRFKNLILDLNRYYKDPWHHWKATLKQKYFNNPWSVISVTAAAFLILLTLIQAVCTVIPLV